MVEINGDRIHVEDIANGIITVINSSISKVGNKIFNLSNDNLNYKIIDIAKFAKKSFPKSKLHIQKVHLIQEIIVSPQKFFNATKFKPKRNILNSYIDFKKIFLQKKIKI